ncbi:MAG: hypothetical protein NC453_15410, partial [Muribaculum sp.]|nr:hypothetical protein [Muribaculum sp.]
GVQDYDRDGKTEVFEVLAYTEKVTGEVVVEQEVIDFILDRGGGDAGIIPQAGAIADLGIKHLAGGQRLVFLDKVDNVERHEVVAAPRHIRQPLVDYNRHNANVLAEHRCGVDRKRGAALIARQRLNRIKRVHTIADFSAKVWTQYAVSKDSIKNRTEVYALLELNRTHLEVLM